MDNDVIARATIEAYVTAAQLAIQANTASVTQKILQALQDLSVDPDFSTVSRKLAQTAHDNIAAATTAAGLASFQSQVAALKGSADALRAATDIATQGKTNLTIPAVAKAADTALTSLKKLKDAVTAIGGDVTKVGAGGLGAIPGQLDTVYNDFKALTDAV